MNTQSTGTPSQSSPTITGPLQDLSSTPVKSERTFLKVNLTRRKPLASEPKLDGVPELTGSGRRRTGQLVERQGRLGDRNPSPVIEAPARKDGVRERTAPLVFEKKATQRSAFERTPNRRTEKAKLQFLQEYNGMRVQTVPVHVPEIPLDTNGSLGDQSLISDLTSPGFLVPKERVGRTTELILKRAPSHSAGQPRQNKGKALAPASSSVTDGRVKGSSLRSSPNEVKFFPLNFSVSDDFSVVDRPPISGVLPVILKKTSNEEQPKATKKNVGFGPVEINHINIESRRRLADGVPRNSRSGFVIDNVIVASDQESLNRRNARIKEMQIFEDCGDGEKLKRREPIKLQDIINVDFFVKFLKMPNDAKKEHIRKDLLNDSSETTKTDAELNEALIKAIENAKTNEEIGKKRFDVC